MWSVTPATKYLSPGICDRLMGEPRTSTPPGVASKFCEKMSRSCAWKRAGRRVGSLFQYRMSNTGGGLPIR
jgi:hypothetical protein